MEKIYVDEPQKNNKKSKWNLFNVSLGLTFAVAFIAMVSILLVGLSGQSYALDDDETAPETIHTNEISALIAMSPTPSAFHEVEVYTATANNETFPVFCVESGVTYAGNHDLNRGDLIDDVGYVYLFSRLEHLSMTDTDAAKNKYLKAWLEQTAIWSYIGQITDAADTKTDDCFKKGTGAACYNEVQQANELYVCDGNPAGCPKTQAQTVITSDDTFYEDFGIVDIINQAIYYHNNNIDALSLTINKAGSEFTLTEDGKYFRSPKLTVVASAGVEDFAEVQDNYSLSLVSAAEGTYVEGIKDGVANRLNDLNDLSLSEYKEFYVYVPKDKVNEQTKRFEVSVSGNFEIYSGYYYTGQGVQSVTRLKTLITSTDNAVPLEIVYSPDVPDTAMNASQGIYLVGLIVLLTGLGILYVNVKKQQNQN
ncbi:MAG: hypothetical protein IJI43_03195 [Bacilli bacterium]|nr:hypothetical protein [Bacilli bacterium]